MALLLMLCAAVPAGSQPSVESLGEQRLADAELFLQDGEWDAALAVLEEVAWYFPDGDPHLAEAAAAKGRARFGKFRDQGDAASSRGDHNAAVSAYEQALGYRDDADVRASLDRERAAQQAVEPPTPEEVTPEEVTPEEVTPEEVTPEEVTPEEVTPEEVTDEEITDEEITDEEITDEEDIGAEIEIGEATPPDIEIGDVNDGDALAHAEIVEPTGDGTSGEAGGGASFPWFLLIAVLAVVALGVVGTRPQVLTVVAGSLQQVGWTDGALAIYQILRKRSADDPQLRAAHAECLAADGRADDEARTIYRAVLDDDPPQELITELARLYWDLGLTDHEAPWLYRTAAERTPGDADLWEAAEACLAEEEVLDRLEIATRLIGMGCPNAERLLLVAEQYTGGEPDEAQRDVFAQVAGTPMADPAVEARRVALLERLLAGYQEFDLTGDDATAIREAYLLSIDQEQRAFSHGERMAGPRASNARVVLAELARLLAESGDSARLFDVYLALLERFRGEPMFLDGLLQAAADTQAYDRALEAIHRLFPRNAEATDPALAMQVALSLMVSGSRNLRERERGSNLESAEFPGLTFFGLARGYLGLIDPEETFRPDVREQIQVFLELYRRNDRHLSVLDAELAGLLWKVGDYPTAASIFFWACGFEPHVSDHSLMLVPGDEAPPCSEFFPEDRSTLVDVIADRPLSIADVDGIAARIGTGAMNTRLALILTGQPISEDVRRYRTGENAPPVILVQWRELASALATGHTRETFQRLVQGLLRFSIPRRSASSVDPARLFGRDGLKQELGRRLRGPVSRRPLIVTGLRGVGKSTLLREWEELPGCEAIGLVSPEADPDLYVPSLWRYLLEEVFETARSSGMIPAPTRFPSDLADPGPGDSSEVYIERLQRILASLPADCDRAGVVLAVDPLDELFPVLDPIDPEPGLADGAMAVLEAMLAVADGSLANVALISRQVGLATTRSPGGLHRLLPEGCDELVVGLLAEPECREFFGTVADDLAISIEDDAIDAFVEASGGHPVVMWSIADSLSASRARGKGEIAGDQVEPILGSVLRSTEFEEFARNLLADFTPAEQTLVRAMAHAADGRIHLQQLSSGVLAALQSEEVEGVLDGLARTTLVTHLSADDYQLRIGLFRRLLATEYPSV
jgi:tetratricopeptide (TPR) repeat protein